MMHDEYNDEPGRAADGAAVPPQGDDLYQRAPSQRPGESPDDPLAALERLQSLSPDAGGGPSPAPVVASAVGAGATGRTRRSRPRVAAGEGSGRLVARIAAPAVFLIAVIALVSIVFQSGVLTGSTPTPTPTVKATKKATSTTKVYVVKSGDTITGIAAKFKTTRGEIMSLNPNLSGSTLVVGTKIRVPK